MIWLPCAALLLLVSSVTSDKQIKLEDIEKDNLKAAQQAKYEKQYQQYSQYSQSPVQYDQQVYSQPGLSYQSPSGYSQYLVPQQYLQQQVYSGYNALPSNSLSAGYSTQSVHPFQAYLNPQIAAVPAVQGVQSSQHIAAPTQTQPIVMAISAPALAALQQQAYYQVLPKMLASLGNVQYIQSQPAAAAATPAQYYYTTQPQDSSSPSQSTSGILYSSQQYVPPFQPIASSKDGANYQQQYLSSAPQTFPSAYASQPEYTSVYQSQPPSFSGNAVYSNTEPPTFVTVKAPQHLVASHGQQQQYLQSQPSVTTISPLQNKYLNSPQYLAQNYNTIQSSHLNPKSSFSSGIKSTVSPPLKLSNSGGFLASPSTNPGISYQAYRNIAG